MEAKLKLVQCLSNDFMLREGSQFTGERAENAEGIREVLLR